MDWTRLFVAEILGHTDIRMTRGTHTVCRSEKREPLEKLVSFSPRQRDAKKAKIQKRQGARPGCKYLILMVEQRGIEPLTSALRMGLDHHCMVCHGVACSNINLQFFNRLQPSQEQFLSQSLTSIFIDSQRVE